MARRLGACLTLPLHLPAFARFASCRYELSTQLAYDSLQRDEGGQRNPNHLAYHRVRCGGLSMSRGVAGRAACKWVWRLCGAASVLGSQTCPSERLSIHGFSFWSVC